MTAYVTWSAPAGPGFTVDRVVKWASSSVRRRLISSSGVSQPVLVPAGRLRVSEKRRSDWTVSRSSYPAMPPWRTYRTSVTSGDGLGDGVGEAAEAIVTTADGVGDAVPVAVGDGGLAAGAFAVQPASVDASTAATASLPHAMTHPP